MLSLKKPHPEEHASACVSKGRQIIQSFETAASPPPQDEDVVDSAHGTRLIGGMPRRLAALACLLPLSAPAAAMVGNTPLEPDDAPRNTIMIVGSAGTFCTGTLIARDLVLTAAHCVLPGASYRFIALDPAKQPMLRGIAKVVPHPQFDLKAFIGNRATPDIALLKAAQPLPGNVAPAAIAGPRPRVAVGDPFLVLGYGVTTGGDNDSGFKLRGARLVATGQPGNLQLRLIDPATKGERAGMGVCTGDSGGPAFIEVNGQRQIAGVVSWSTGPKLAPGCGGISGITPIGLYRGWIVETAKKLGSEVR